MKDAEDYDIDLSFLMIARDNLEQLYDVPYVRQALEYIDKATSHCAMKLSLLDETL